MLKIKFNSFWTGLCIGMLSPVVCFLLYWLFVYAYMSFPVRFITYLITGNMLSNVLKVCTLGNLIWFYLSMKKNADAASKGILTSVFVYLIIVLWISYAIEIDLS
jgi:ACR3 family arsenite efflux pump ArsB